MTLPPDRNSIVIDHFNYDRLSSPEQHDVILAPYPTESRLFASKSSGGSSSTAPLLAYPSGIAQVLSTSNPMLQSILKAPRTAVTHNPKEDEPDEPWGLGAQLSLVTGFQARNDARLSVVGAASLLTNDWLNSQVQSAAGKLETSNEQFLKDLVNWTFQRTGVLKVLAVRHWSNQLTETLATQGNATQMIVGGQKNPSIYRINQDVVFEIDVAEYDTDHWIPLQVDEDDELQLEFSMLSPFYRVPLQPVKPGAADSATGLYNGTTFRAEFRTPDQHGIFNFRVNYKRPFFSNLDVKERVTVRHMAHDEWPRSWEIRGSWVWIFGIGTVITGWTGFISMWMYGDWST